MVTGGTVDGPVFQYIPLPNTNFLSLFRILLRPSLNTMACRPRWRKRCGLLTVILSQNTHVICSC